MRLRSLVLLGTIACSSPAATPREPTAPLAPTGASVPAGAGPEVRAELLGPTRVRYVPSLLGPTRSLVRIVVVNRGNAPLDVSNLRMRLEATRDGVAFPCAADVGAAPNAREPGAIGVGRSATFERALDCSLPLSGDYVVKVVVAFGSDGPWSAGQPVRTLALSVRAAPNSEPRPIESVPGLWGAVGGSNLLPGSNRETSGRLAVTIVNGTSAEIGVPPLRLALRVYRAGLDIPCEDEPIALTAPPTLRPGASHVQRIEVSCLGLGKPGDYVIVGRLLVPGDPRESELGRIRIEVSTDPARVVLPR